jgi:hypothetical protein
MRKLALAMATAAALSISSAANAVIIIGGSTNVDLPITVTNTATGAFVEWGKNPEPSGSFSGYFEFNNTDGGLYSIIASTSTIGGTMTGISLSGAGGAPVFASVVGSAKSLDLLTDYLASGNYRLTFTGTAPAGGGVASGNFTFLRQGVPEPATWGMMLIGFAGIGLAMRSRRRPVLAQVA